MNDTDEDGYGDNINGNNPDIFPFDPTQWVDLDRDGHGDNKLGTDGDHFPNNPEEWADTDSDGIGDNTDAIGCSGGATPVIERTIIAYNRGGRAIGCEDANSVPVVSCTDIFGNAGGDWIEYIADQYGVRDNGSEDPLFCSVAIGEECPWLQDCSPCLDWAGCGRIGSLGLGCECGTGGPSQVESRTWGGIKSVYR